MSHYDIQSALTRMIEGEHTIEDYRLLTKVVPRFCYEEDNCGQIVIYTGVYTGFDYPDTYMVNVSQEDIDKAREECSVEGVWVACACAVAQCLQRQIDQPGLQIAVTTDYGLLVHIDPHWYKLPAEGKKFIQDFDAGEDVKPISFTIEKVEDPVSWYKRDE